MVRMSETAVRVSETVVRISETVTCVLIASSVWACQAITTTVRRRWDVH